MKSSYSTGIIDQLVCGELRDDGYREALHWLEANPQRWRDCALAFLQEQAIEQEIQRLAASNAGWEARSGPSTSAAVSDHCSLDAEFDEEGLSPTQSPAPRVADPSEMQVGLASRTHQNSVVQQPALDSRHESRPLKLAGLAAVLLLSFAAGWFASMAGSGSGMGGVPLAQQPLAQESFSQETFAQGPPVQESVLKDRSGVPFEKPFDARNALPANSITHFASNSDGNSRSDFGSSWKVLDSAFRNNSAQSGNLPTRLLPIDQEIPQVLRDLERMGRIRIEISSALMPVENENGTSVLVPVQQLQIVPVVYSY